MRLAACQMPDVCGDVSRALALIISYTADAAGQGARLVCFPESFLHGHVVELGHVERLAVDLSSPEFTTILDRLSDLEPILVIGLFEKDGGRLYNSAIVVERRRLLGVYRKRNLIGKENDIFTPGSEAPVFELGDLKFSINICYDMQFRVCATEAATAGAGLLVCLANNMLTRATAEEWRNRHNELRGAHARSARLWLLSSDVTGRARRQSLVRPHGPDRPLWNGGATATSHDIRHAARRRADRHKPRRVRGLVSVAGRILTERTEALRRLDEVLGGTAGVSAAAYFGSIGEESVDAFSDIDLVVRCGAGTPERIVAALDHVLDVVLYRPFTEGRRPSGRYWFRDLSPFLRLDVSFYAAAAYDELIVRGKGFAQPPFKHVTIDKVSIDPPLAEPLREWSETEWEFAGALRNFHESAKSSAREVTPKHSLGDSEEAVRRFEARGLRPEIWQLYERTVELIDGTA